MVSLNSRFFHFDTKITISQKLDIKRFRDQRKYNRIEIVFISIKEWIIVYAFILINMLFHLDVKIIIGQELDIKKLKDQRNQIEIKLSSFFFKR